jgi:uncharacterized protein YoxC
MPMNLSFSKDTLELVSGSTGYLLAGLFAILAICWLLLPILVITALRQLNSTLIEFRNDVRLNDRSLSARLDKTNAALAELVVAMRAFDENAHQAAQRASTRLGNLDVHAEHTNDLLKWLGSILQGNAQPKP